MNEVLIYEKEDGQSAVEVRLEKDTLWLSLRQIADLFGRDKSVISRHLKKIFETNELDMNSVVAKNATTAADGKTYLDKLGTPVNKDAWEANNGKLDGIKSPLFQLDLRPFAL